MERRADRLMYNTEYNKDPRTRGSSQRKRTEATDIYFDTHGFEALLRRAVWLVERMRRDLRLLKDHDTGGRPPPPSRPQNYDTPSKFLGSLRGVK